VKDGAPRFVEGPVLGIETSGRLTGAALLLGGRLLEESALDARALSQEVLAERIDGMLRARGLRPRDLERIGVALGPGSFTGVRVGLATARGMAIGAACPLAGVPSHEALAWPFRGLEATVVLLTGLRCGEVFVEAGVWKEDRWTPALSGRSLPVREARAELLRLAGGGPLLFLGEAAPVLRAEFPELARAGTWIEDPLAAVRRPAVIALLAARLGAALHAGEETDRLAPLYLRGADAQAPRGRPGVAG
jgi:tRNA threonylcarbamoyladenosine biosynthesis protein TsaB